MRYSAVIEYDGTAYCGFQRQRNQPSVQETIEKAITAISNRSIRIIGAARTDSGVHALGQVIAFDLEWRHPPEALRKALNHTLPTDVAIVRLKEAREDFHPRYDALSRSYEYHIYNRTNRSPLMRLNSWHVTRPLELALLNEAAALVVGTHDFATFGQPPQGVNTNRTVYSAGWICRDDIMVFEISANAFLQRMVRSLVGSMKAVGEGSWTVESFAAALKAADRSRAAKTAPAQGLYLVSVGYENDV